MINLDNIPVFSFPARLALMFEKWIVLILVTIIQTEACKEGKNYHSITEAVGTICVVMPIMSVPSFARWNKLK